MRGCARNFMEDIEDSDQKCLQGLLWWTLLFCFKWLQTYSSMQIQLFLIFFFFFFFFSSPSWIDEKKIGCGIRKIDGEIDVSLSLLKEKIKGIFIYLLREENARERRILIIR